MRLFHKQRGAAVPLVLCLKLKNIKSTAGMFLNTQHNSWWRNNEVTVLVDEPGPRWVYNQQFQVRTQVQRSRRAARNHRFGFCAGLYIQNLGKWCGFGGRDWVSRANTECGPQRHASVMAAGREWTRLCVWREGFTGNSQDLGFYSGTLQKYSELKDDRFHLMWTKQRKITQTVTFNKGIIVTPDK